MLQFHDGSCPASCLSLDEFSQKKIRKFAPFLNVLCEASEYANDLASPLWEFGLRLENARTMGLNDNDLRWMVKKDWIAYRCSNGGPSPEDELTYFGPQTRFVIARKGMELGGVQNDGVQNDSVQKDGGQFFQNADLDVSPIDVGEVVTPFWDDKRRELSVEGEVVKQFRWPAPNQETILSVFSEENWPARIEDPLSQGQGLEPKRRLSDTIKCLNRNQRINLIRFRGDGTGEGVFWEFLDPVTQRPTDLG